MPHKEVYRNGKRLVSVTELQSIISKPFLDRWREGLCDYQNGKCGFTEARKVAEAASKLGNEVHELVAEYLKDPEAQVTVWDSDAHRWAGNIIDKLKELNIKKYLIEPESVIVDEESGLVGSPDFCGTDGNSNFIGDFKIKNSLDSLMALQGYGYKYLLKRKHSVDFSRMLAVWAQKKTKGMLVKPVWIDLDPWKDEWMALVKLWNRLNPNRKVVVHE